MNEIDISGSRSGSGSEIYERLPNEDLDRLVDPDDDEDDLDDEDLDDEELSTDEEDLSPRNGSSERYCLLN